MSSYEEILKKYWGFDSFRGIQKEIIESIGSGRDTLGLMPTGGGKSITFQVPALASEGVCIVITPLIALMRDQVMNLRKRGIKAAAIHSSMPHDKILSTLDNCVFGAIKILYVSPERLSSELFMAKFRHMKISFITVDEAHCICQWGYDFRPSYLKIADIRYEKPDAPILALTATATPEVVDDIQEKLGFRQKNVFRMSFERKNLAYVVRKTEDKDAELLKILGNTDGSAIVYVRKRTSTKYLSRNLSSQGISAAAFNALVDDQVKEQVQKDWLSGKTRVMVATNAFGMGIDKPDVRVVVHYDCPDSIEAYFQEAGRAGRDGKKAYAVMLTDDYSPIALREMLRTSFPRKDYLRQVYDHLSYYFQVAVDSGYNATFEFKMAEFCRRFKHVPARLEPALNLLTLAGYIEYSGDIEVLPSVHFEVGRDDLYYKRNITPAEDQLIEVLLRNYSGLFSNMCFFSEDFLALKMGISKSEVCERLISLSHKRILVYFPRQKSSFIRYTQRREDSEHLIFQPSIYEERLQRALTRAKSMVEYLGLKDVCRSEFLLKYFGEDIDHECGVCDVCVQKKKEEFLEISEKIRQEILSLLSDGKDHLANEITELLSPSFSQDYIGVVLREMFAHDEILYKEGVIAISQRKS